MMGQEIRIARDRGRELKNETGSLTEEMVQKIPGVDRPVKAETEKPVTVKLPAEVYRKYFSNVAIKDVQGILESALEMYFVGTAA